MSFSTQLTEMYHLLKNSNDSLEYIYSKDFEEYLNRLNLEQFVNSVFVYGYEVRDSELGSIDNEILKLIELVTAVFDSKFKSEIESSDQLQTIYNLGLINMYFYFCERQVQTTGSPQFSETLKSYLSEKDPSLLAEHSASDVPAVVKLSGVNRSVNFLKLATKLASETINISSGIYTYHTIKAFDYIFSIFQNYKVDNNNKPIDLDSFYIFSDQLDSETLWVELAKQMKLKYGS